MIEEREIVGYWGGGGAKKRQKDNIIQTVLFPIVVHLYGQKSSLSLKRKVQDNLVIEMS